MYLVTAVFFALALVAPQAPATEAVEREARQIERMLIAPCCWTQPVSEHRSQASDEVKQQIRVLLASGKSRDEVLSSFAAQYGERILAEPPATGFGAVLYVGLPLVLLLSGAALVVFVRRAGSRYPQAAAAAQPATPDDGRYAARLEEELRDMD